MIIDNSKGLNKLLAEEGKKITNSERSFFSDFIYLGKNDSPDNYQVPARYREQVRTLLEEVEQ